MVEGSTYVRPISKNERDSAILVQRMSRTTVASDG